MLRRGLNGCGLSRRHPAGWWRAGAPIRPAIGVLHWVRALSRRTGRLATPDNPITDTLRAEATRAGVGVTEYVKRLEHGDVWCHAHQDWHPGTAFPQDRRSHTGRAANCRDAILHQE